MPDYQRDKMLGDLGERLARLEEWRNETAVKLQHLDECMDSIRDTIVKWDHKWSKWFWIACGVVLGMIFSAGNGVVSLKTLLDVLKKG
jgi:hypothetical protein